MTPLEKTLVCTQLDSKSALRRNRKAFREVTRSTRIPVSTGQENDYDAHHVKVRSGGRAPLNLDSLNRHDVSVIPKTFTKCLLHVHAQPGYYFNCFHGGEYIS